MTCTRQGQGQPGKFSRRTKKSCQSPVWEGWLTRTMKRHPAGAPGHPCAKEPCPGRAGIHDDSRQYVAIFNASCHFHASPWTFWISDEWWTWMESSHGRLKKAYVVCQGSVGGAPSSIQHAVIKQQYGLPHMY